MSKTSKTCLGTFALLLFIKYLHSNLIISFKRDFVSICNTALQVNGRMICEDQREYHLVLKDNYNKLCSALTDLLDEQFLPCDDGSLNGGGSVHRQSMALFSAISGAPSNSSSA